MVERLRRLLVRLAAFAMAAIRWQPGREARMPLVVVAFMLFTTVTVIAVLHLPQLRLRTQWLPLMVALTMGSVAINALEFWLVGTWLGQRFATFEVLQISVLASAANLAPVPGAVLVRARALCTRGADLGQAARTLAMVGVGWLTVALFAAGIAFASLQVHSLALAASLTGLLGIALLPCLRPKGTSAAGVLWQCVALEVLSVGLQAGRYLVVFRALAVDADWRQAIGFPLAGAMASAMGFLPGGLGLRELLAGAIAEAVALPAAGGVVASAFDRVVGLCVLAVAALVSLVVAGRYSQSEPTD